MDDDALQKKFKSAIPPLMIACLLALLNLALQVGWVDPGNWNWGALARDNRLKISIVAMIFFGVAVYRGWRPRPRTEGLSGWAVAVAIVVVGVVAWGATTWLLQEADAATDRGAARVDAIKTGLGIGAGTTGIFALLLAVRRQTHQERTATDVNFDAAEKRVTELYTKASDQLGSDKAAVRLAGLYSLERLAQDNPKHRQTIINVLCAYLRMPFEYPGASPGGDVDKDQRQEHREQTQELQVRATAQKLLGDHLNPRRSSDYWGLMTLDLGGAHLHNLMMIDCTIKSAYFEDATFTGTPWFTNVTFVVTALFDRAVFASRVHFERSNFPKRTSFDDVIFSERPSFDQATFGEKASLARVTLRGHPIGGPADLGIVQVADED